MPVGRRWSGGRAAGEQVESASVGPNLLPRGVKIPVPQMVLYG